MGVTGERETVMGSTIIISVSTVSFTMIMFMVSVWLMLLFIDKTFPLKFGASFWMIWLKSNSRGIKREIEETFVQENQFFKVKLTAVKIFTRQDLIPESFRKFTNSSKKSQNRFVHCFSRKSFFPMKSNTKSVSSFALSKAFLFLLYSFHSTFREK